MRLCCIQDFFRRNNLYFSPPNKIERPPSDRSFQCSKISFLSLLFLADNRCLLQHRRRLPGCNGGYVDRITCRYVGCTPELSGCTRLIRCTGLVRCTGLRVYRACQVYRACRVCRACQVCRSLSGVPGLSGVSGLSGFGCQRLVALSSAVGLRIWLRV